MKIKIRGAFRETKKYRRQRLIRGLIIPEDTEVYAFYGRNWIWYKVQTDNMAAVFRLHRGTAMEYDLDTTLSDTTFTIDDYYEFFEDLESGKLIASYILAKHLESGYEREDVKRNFDWLDKMFRENAEWLEKTLVGFEEYQIK